MTRCCAAWILGPSPWTLGLSAEGLLVPAPRRLLAPREDRAFVAEPPLAEAGPLIVRNRHALARFPGTLLGRPWDELRSEARQAALAEACQYLRDAGERVPTWDGSSLLMSGHQPELFHPGVWAKNFALHGLARAHGGTPVNLTVDNDTAKSAALRLPERFGDMARLVSLPFDTWSGEIPYEELRVRDEALFGSVAKRVADVTAGWGFRPMLHEFWGELKLQAERTPLLGERFAAGRRAFERRWGCHNLELPVSRLCRTGPFAWFVCHLLAEAARFHATYNACVQEYRQRYHIRSRNHPVPELAADSRWLELPLWAWRSERPRRGRLMVRPGTRGIELRVGKEAWPTLPAAGQDPGRAVAAYRELEQGGYRIRSRALTNTLYARLLLADLFIHGIGGGKYDELTDEIARRFYGVEPPRFLVLSATLLLPLAGFPGSRPDVRRLQHELHDLRTNPQRHLEPEQNAGALELAERKSAWIRRKPVDGPAERERFRALKDVTRQMQPFVAEQKNHLVGLLARADRDVQANAVLKRRDFAFCLYPSDLLRGFCLSFALGGCTFDRDGRSGETGCKRTAIDPGEYKEACP